MWGFFNTMKYLLLLAAGLTLTACLPQRPKLPEIPEIEVPEPELPEVEVPEVAVPEVKAPDLQIPSLP